MKIEDEMEKAAAFFVSRRKIGPVTLYEYESVARESSPSPMPLPGRGSQRHRSPHDYVRTNFLPQGRTWSKTVLSPRQKEMTSAPAPTHT